MALSPQHAASAPAAEPARISVVVCAYNEERYVKACLHSVLAQSRQPDQVLLVNNASTDGTRRIAERIEGVEVIDECRRGLVRARETGRRHATGDLLVYLDADSRLPLGWLEMVERAFRRRPGLVGLSGAFRFYDWDCWGRFLVWLYRLHRGATDARAGAPRARHRRGVLRRRVLRSASGPRGDRRIRHDNRVPWRRHQPRPAPDRGGHGEADLPAPRLHLGPALPPAAAAARC